jgi:uncharacterized protein DUF3147
MKEMLFRFLVGGIVVSTFSALGDVLKPKSFAGLFGAAPSVALATLALTIAKEGVHYTSIEARSMLAGAVALGVYSHLVMDFMAHRKRSAILVSMGLLSVWFTVAFGLYVVVFR